MRLRSSALITAILLAGISGGALQAAPCGEDCGYRQAGWKEFSAIPGADLPGQLDAAPLPSEIDLSAQMPPVGQQGEQASCVSWAAVYAVKSFYEQKKRNWSYDSPMSGGPGHHVFSPAFSQAYLGNRSKGVTFPEALDVLLNHGAVPWSEMPYSASNTGASVPTRLGQIAGQFRISGYRLLSSRSPESIKRQIAAGNPVMVGMLLYENLLDLKDGIYAGPSGKFMGGHSVVIVGYDDDRGGGAFKVMNSWGNAWGMDGFGWISYDAMASLIRAALIIENSDLPEGQPALALPAPGRLVASRGDASSEIQVQWDHVATALAYEIQRSAGDSDFKAIGFATTTIFRDTTVDPGRTYAYRVLAISEKGKSDPAKAPVVEGYAMSNPDPGSRIALVDGRVLQKGSQLYAVLEWSATGNSFEVQRWNDSLNDWTTLGRVQESRFTDYRISPGARYTYRVRSLQGSIKGLWSSPVVLNAAGKNLPPSIVTGLRVSQGSIRGKIQLAWDPAPGVEEYRIYRYDPKSKKWEGPFRTNEAAFQDSSSDLRPGEWYGYRIVAVNAAGSGPTTPVVYGKTSTVLTAERSIKSLNAPEIISVGSGSRIPIAWKSVEGADSYEIRAARLPGEDYRQMAIVDGTSMALNFPGAKGELYSIRVFARSGPSVSPASEPAVVFQNPETPRERFLGIFDSNPWSERSKFIGLEWKSDGSVAEYSLHMSGNKPVQARLTGPGIDRTFSLNGPASSRSIVSGGFEFRRSGDGRIIELSDPLGTMFYSGHMVFLAQ